MTKQLKDLFKSFPDMSTSEQLEKITEVRNTRSIERPAVAKRRRKKEHATSDKKQKKAKQMISNLTEEEREELIRRLSK